MNEAAERLRRHLAALTSQTVNDVAWLDALDEALAVERRATVERIRAAVDEEAGSEDKDEEYLWAVATVRAILDAEAAR